MPTYNEEGVVIDDKYIVMKITDFHAYRESLIRWVRDLAKGKMRDSEFVMSVAGIEQRLRLDDAVVIRRQDFLSVGQLELYAITIDLIRRILIEAGAPDAAIALEPQQHYFDAQARAARKEAHKLPTV